MAKQNKKNKKRTGKIRQRERKNFVILLFVFAILFSVVLTEIAYILYKVQYLKIINAEFEIADSIGFALGKEELDFGVIPPGSSATRYIDAENEGTRNVILEIWAAGKIKDFMSYGNYILIQPNETRRLSFSVSVPETAQKGKYSGRIFLIFKRT